MSLLKDAIAKGVNFNMVNLMTMDFGNTSADEADETLSSGNGFHSQLKQIFPSKTSSQLRDIIGITDLIGQNDDSEIFTASDGAKVLSFAKQHQIGELSFWALSRDNGSCSGVQHRQQKQRQGSRCPEPVTGERGSCSAVDIGKRPAESAMDIRLS